MTGSPTAEGSARFVPALQWLAADRRPWLKADGVAGLNTAAGVIPKDMAYATGAGRPGAACSTRLRAACSTAPSGKGSSRCGASRRARSWW